MKLKRATRKTREGRRAAGASGQCSQGFFANPSIRLDQWNPKGANLKTYSKEGVDRAVALLKFARQQRAYG